MRRVATSVPSITDPLVKYQSLVATGVYSSDLAQLRLAHHLQKLYLRLKDYSPSLEHQRRLQQITRAVKSEGNSRDSSDGELAVENHPIWRNPLFSKFLRKTEARDSLALTRVLTSHQAALQINSPRGLFLSGDVGIGKSFLLDLLADGLPTSRKKRWHFNTFMLYAFARLEHFRKSRQLESVGEEYSLLWMAKEMIEESPVLFLDEFQLPDRAASKILNNLFIAFFQLGGVLVASSNRMPEELEKATGIQYSPPATGGLIEQVLGLGRRHMRGELFGETSGFAAFLEVLKARCDFWYMEGARDWRREKGIQSSPTDLNSQGTTSSASPSAASLNGVSEDTISLDLDKQVPSKPAMYFLPEDGSETWEKAIASCFGTETIDFATLQRASLIVYGREILVAKQRDGISYWKFEELVRSFGPADYITLAANYHTFVIDQVPALTVMMKNEARRFITFLDALYEARCKLVVRAEAIPDNLFFPEMKRVAKSTNEAVISSPGETDDATYSETIAEVYQDQVSPFRPNVSTFGPDPRYNPGQDSDFGPEPGKRIDFGNTGAFTGEDERFAYKRAVSRLWELCSAPWHARHGDWWQPLNANARHWEGSVPSTPLSKKGPTVVQSEITMGPSAELQEPVGLERFSIERLRNGAKGERPASQKSMQK